MLEPGGQRLGRDVVADDVVPAGGAHLGDPSAHDAGAEHPDGPDRRRARSSQLRAHVVSTSFARLTWSTRRPRPRGELPESGTERNDLVGQQRLRSVAAGRRRVGVHVHHDPVGARGDGCECHRRDERAPTGAVRRVHDDGEVRPLLRDDDRGEVERVAGRRFERPDPALAQDDVEVAGMRDVLGREQPLFDGRGEPPLDHHRLPGLRARAQQLEVLHVPGAHAHDVDDVDHELELLDVEHLGHPRQPEARPLLGDHRQPVRSEPLERVRRRPVLVEVAAEHRRAGRDRSFTGRRELLRGLHRARSRDEREHAGPHEVLADPHERAGAGFGPADERVGVLGAGHGGGSLGIGWDEQAPKRKEPRPSGRGSVGVLVQSLDATG